MEIALYSGIFFFLEFFTKNGNFLVCALNSLFVKAIARISENSECSWETNGNEEVPELWPSRECSVPLADLDEMSATGDGEEQFIAIRAVIKRAQLCSLSSFYGQERSAWAPHLPLLCLLACAHVVCSAHSAGPVAVHRGSLFLFLVFD